MVVHPVVRRGRGDSPREPQVGQYVQQPISPASGTDDPTTALRSGATQAVMNSATGKAAPIERLGIEKETVRVEDDGSGYAGGFHIDALVVLAVHVLI
jgi:hypothetical protein